MFESPARMALLAAGVLTVFLGLVGVFWATSSSSINAKPIAQQWMEAISQLGIEPAYPPEEDVSVGDVYVFLTYDKLHDLSAEALPLKSVKIAHLDLTKELKDTYKQMYEFPRTVDRPKEAASVWHQQPSPKSIFDVDDERKELPIVLFPDFKLATVRAADANVSGILNEITTKADLKANSSSTVTVKIEGAETYGLSAIPSELALTRFCNAPETRPVCTDDGMRRQLSTLVGSDIYEKTVGLAGAKIWRFGVEIGIVTRVFLIRSIQTTIDQLSSLSGQADAGGDKKSNSKDLKAPNVASAENVGFSAVPSVSTVVQSSGSSSVSVTQTFERPVVIGFRSVRWSAR